MSTATFAGIPVDVNEEGFFTDPKQWTKEMAPEIAAEIASAQSAPQDNPSDQPPPYPGRCRSLDRSIIDVRDQARFAVEERVVGFVLAAEVLGAKRRGFRGLTQRESTGTSAGSVMTAS